MYIDAVVGRQHIHQVIIDDIILWIETVCHAEASEGSVQQMTMVFTER